MKKLFTTLLIAIITLSASFTAKAIEDPYPKGTMIAGAYFGVWPGIGAVVTGDYTITNLWKGHLTGGIHATWDRQVFREYIFDYSTGDYVIEKTPMQFFCVAPRVTYGLNITQQFEVHAGVLLGIAIPVNNPPVAFCLTDVLGLRYFFTENFGLSFEVAPLFTIKWHDEYLPRFSTTANFGINFKF